MNDVVKEHLLGRNVEELGEKLLSETEGFRKDYSEEDALECAKEEIILKAVNEVEELQADAVWFEKFKQTAEFKELDAYLQIIYYAIKEEITANSCFFFYQLTHDRTKPFHFELNEGFVQMRKALEDNKKRNEKFNTIVNHSLFKLYLLEKEWRKDHPKVSLTDSEKIQAFYAKKKSLEA